MGSDLKSCRSDFIAVSRKQSLKGRCHLPLLNADARELTGDEHLHTNI